MNKQPALIVDNFFENPEAVRKFALEQRTYEPCDFYVPGIYSGYRTAFNNSLFEMEIRIKIENLTDKAIKDLNLAFHINTETSVCGCPHRDIQNDQSVEKITKSFAGVIYLNPNPPPYLDTGTTLYDGDKNPHSDIENYFWKMQIIYDIALPSDNLIKQKFGEEIKSYKEKMGVIQKCQNVYNRMIIYPSNILHSPDNYFGRTLEDGRLTIPIHGTFE